MRQSVTKDLYAYWSNLKGARSAPDRSDIDPAAIRHVLADTFIIEIDPACRFPIRLCGTRVNALWLHERKGDSFLDLWRDEDKRNVAQALLTVIDGATPLVAGVRTRPVEGFHALDMEMLLLPLRHFGKTHSRLLGSLTHSGQPDWIGRMPATPLQLQSMRVISASEARSAATAGRRVRARPHLVVHQGGKAAEN